MENRGFLFYCTLTYSFLIAYMKDIHLSVEAYHPKKYNAVWERKLTQ